MSLHQVVRLIITKVQAPAYYIRGRFFYMYRPATKRIATHVSQAIGKLLLPTPIFTAEEREACPKEQRAHLGLGPVPKYMKDEFFYTKTDRTPGFNDSHFQPNLLLSAYRNNAYKTLAWRCFVIGTLLSASAIVVANTATGMISTGEVWGDKVLAATQSEPKTQSSLATVSDDTSFIPSDLKSKMDADVKGNVVLSDDMQKQVDDTSDCAAFIADLVNGGNNTRLLIDMRGEPLKAARKVDVCEKAGFRVDRPVAAAIAPLKWQLAAAVYESLLEGMVDTHAPDSFTSEERNKLIGDFGTCSQDLKSLRRFATPTLTDHTTAAFLARRYQVCAAHNAINPPILN